MAAQSRVQVFALGVHKVGARKLCFHGRYRAREIPAPERDQLEQAGAKPLGFSSEARKTPAKSQLHLYLFLYNVFKPPYIF